MADEQEQPEEEQKPARKYLFPLLPRKSIIGAVRDRVMSNPIIGSQLDKTRESITKSISQAPGNVLSGEIYSRLKRRQI